MRYEEEDLYLCIAVGALIGATLTVFFHIILPV
jgi:hypothetical protein